MTTQSELVADLQATVDYIRNDITNRADDFELGDAHELTQELRRVQRAAGDSIAMLEQGMVKRVEAGAQQVGDLVFTRVRNYVTRFRHDKIAAEVRERAVTDAIDKETGEVSGRLAADNAVKLMSDLYLAPAVKAKTGVLKRLEIKGVVQTEDKGWKLNILDTGLGTDGDDEDDD